MSYIPYGIENATLASMLAYNSISVSMSMAAAALVMVARWHLFKKLDMPGWKGLIPYYADYMIYKTVWKTKPFWVIVIASGIYAVAAVAACVSMAVMMVANATAGDESLLLSTLIGFCVFYGLLTLAYVAVAVVINVKMSLRLAKEFGKGTGFALGLAFVSAVFYPILAFGKAQRVTSEPGTSEL